MTRTFESEETMSREEAAALLQNTADGVTAGTVRFGQGEDMATLDVPENLRVEVEFEVEDGEVEVELELEWPESATADATVSDTGSETADQREDETGDETEVDPADETEADPGDLPASVELPVGPDGSLATLARFEVFRDRRDEWRWRLVHRNGNVIATSGEGYTRRHNALKGLRSVMRNATEATVQDG